MDFGRHYIILYNVIQHRFKKLPRSYCHLDFRKQVSFEIYSSGNIIMKKKKFKLYVNIFIDVYKTGTHNKLISRMYSSI